MFELLYGAYYIILFAIVFICFTVAQLMTLINVGKSKILSPIIGTAVGWLIIWAAPNAVAGIVVSIIVTIISNLVLTHAIYSKHGDQYDKTTKGNRK